MWEAIKDPTDLDIIHDWMIDEGYHENCLKRIRYLRYYHIWPYPCRRRFIIRESNLCVLDTRSKPDAYIWISNISILASTQKESVLPISIEKAQTQYKTVGEAIRRYVVGEI